MSSSILVCGNGPSCKEIDFTRVPGDVKVMRVTNFYFEDKYLAGNRLDYYVDYIKRLDNQYFNIRTLHSKGEYEIDMENLWWTVMFEPNPHITYTKSCTDIIQKIPLIAEFRCFYEYYYGKYLPTGIQAIALAFCLGFEHIYLAGFDLFSDINDMHSYVDGRKSVETLRGYKKTSIYDSGADTTNGNLTDEEAFKYIHNAHPTDMQIDFLRLLERLFPNTKLLSACETSAINEYINVADKIYNKPWYKVTDKPADRTTDWYPLPDSMPSRKT